jgi:hypothetical protein
MKMPLVIFFLLSFCLPIYAQCDIESIENEISKECENCSQSDLTILLFDKCNIAKVRLDSLVKSFEIKLKNQQNIKQRIKSIRIFKQILKSQIKMKKTFLQSIDIIYENGTINDFTHGLYDYYLSKNILIILKEVESNILGD